MRKRFGCPIIVESVVEAVNLKQLEQATYRFAGALAPSSLLHRDMPTGRVIRLAVSVGAIAVILAFFLRFSYVERAEIVLTLLLAVLGIAIRWGIAEAMAAAVMASLFVEFFLLPPVRLRLSVPQHWIALSAFLVTAVATSGLSIRARKKEREAGARRFELESLYRFCQVAMQGASLDSTLRNVIERLSEVFGFESVAVFFAPRSGVFRSGSPDNTLDDLHLRSVYESGSPVFALSSQVSVTPIRIEGRVAGSLGLSGGGLSRTAVEAITQQVEIALEKAIVLEDAARTEAARKSDELKSVVLDALAHDLKTPLASIKAAATCLLSDDCIASLANRELLSVINEETDRLNRIMNEAVEIAKIEGGILELEKRQHGIRETVYAALDDLNAAASGRKVKVDIPDDLPTVDIDFRLVKQVFKQLLDNALKYSPEDSPVAVTSQRTGQHIIVNVLDSGPGIPEEEQDRIFDKYYRGFRERQDTSGTGMGLTIAKSIVEKHGGCIWVTNCPEGGAMFNVSFPIQEARVF